MLPWFNNMRPLYLAPMAGVTDSVFRRLCKEQGADVLVTEFVSADGILHRNERTREMVSFREEERPVGVQLFGADPQRMADAAKAVRDCVNPETRPNPNLSFMGTGQLEGRIRFPGSKSSDI